MPDLPAWSVGGPRLSGRSGLWHRERRLGNDENRRGASALLVPAVALQHLDLVAVRILHEEEARHQRAVAVELLDVRGFESELLEAPVLGVEVVDRERDVAVAVAVLIGFASPLVDR